MGWMSLGLAVARRTFNLEVEFNHIRRPLVLPGLPANCESSCGEGIAGCWRRRRRKRGRRAGVLLRLKRLLGDPTIPAGVCILVEAEGLECYHIAPRSWDDQYVWLRWQSSRLLGRLVQM
ncbi:hypothetical protein MHYP_G00297420 [Metynnis hypsauchen]